MYKRNKANQHRVKVNNSYEGESIERKIDRILNNKEPITDGSPVIYTERKDGVRPEYDIRTDRFEVAVDAMDKVQKSHTARRQERLDEKAGKKKDAESGDTKGDPKPGEKAGGPGTESKGETA